MSHALWIDDAPVGVGDLFAIVTGHPVIRASARALIERGARPSQVRGLRDAYVFQREYAAVPRDRPCLVGSDRATTCQILIATSPTKVFCAHLDGSPGQMTALTSALRETFQDNAKLDVHLAGGFTDERGLSVALGRDLLAALERGWPGVRFHLKTACIGPLNTVAGAPAVRALAFDTRSGQMIPNVWFTERGPHAEWRAARASYGASPLVRATDAATGEYRLDPADTLSVPDRRYLEEMLKMDDRTLLQVASTSPDVEHDAFCEETRATLRYLLNLQ